LVINFELNRNKNVINVRLMNCNVMNFMMKMMPHRGNETAVILALMGIDCGEINERNLFFFETTAPLMLVPSIYIVESCCWVVSGRGRPYGVFKVLVNADQCF
jgi:hypothetical protein